MATQISNKIKTQKHRPESLDFGDIINFEREYKKAAKESKKRCDKAVAYLVKAGVNVEYVHTDENPFMEDSEVKYNFEISLNGQKFPFSQSHVDAWRPCFGRVTYDHKFKSQGELEGQNLYPDLFGLLNCLASDATVLDQLFEEWAEDLGYDTDSISAKKTYTTCQENTIKAKQVLDLAQVAIDLEEMGEN